MIGSTSRFSLLIGAEGNRPRPAACPTESVQTVDENGEETTIKLGAEGMPLARDRFEPAVPDASLAPRERIDALLREMPPCRPILLSIIRVCAEPVPAAQVNELAEEQLRYCTAAFGASELCALLRRAGALELVTEDGEPYPEGEQQPRAVGSAADETRADGADGTDDATEDAAETDEDGAVGETDAAEAPGAVDASGTGVSDAHPDGAPTRLAAGEPAIACWRATPDGLAAARADDPVARIAALFEDDGLYLPLYKCILTLCAREGGARTPALGAAVNGHPLVQRPRLFATYFIDRLEKAGALAWRGTWVATEAGIEGLGLLDGVEDIELAPGIDDARAPEPSFIDELGLLES